MKEFTIKKWYVIETNLYFVPHTKERRNPMGPFLFKFQAERAALWHANRALRNKEMVEYFVRKLPDTRIYGVSNAEAKPTLTTMQIAHDMSTPE